MKNILKTIIILSIFQLSSCDKKEDFATCDPAKGIFIDGKHYIKSDFIDEDGNWNYLEWNEYRRKSSKLIPSTNCIPIKEISKLEDQIERAEKTIDLMR